MSNSALLRETLALPGRNFDSGASPVITDSGSMIQIPLPAITAANTGTLTTRTDDDDGVATLSAGHGIVSTNLVTLFWEGGIRFGMEATVSGDAVTVNGGDGDNLPSQSTAVTVVKQTIVSPLVIDGDTAKFIAFIYESATSGRGHIDLQDSSDDSVHEFEFARRQDVGGFANIIDVAKGDTNPYDSDLTAKAYVAHTSLSAGALFCYVGHDAVSEQ